jgi:aminodeoxychorismate synthase component I
MSEFHSFSSPGPFSQAHPFPLIHSFPLPNLNVFEIYSRIALPNSPSFLLESGKGELGCNRYSFLGTNPSYILSGKGSQIEIRKDGQTFPLQGNPFETLTSICQSSHTTNDSTLPPFLGGVVGFLSYDLVRQFESLPNLTDDSLSSPDLEFLIIELFVAIDHHTQTLHCIFSPSPDRLRTTTSKTLHQEGLEGLAMLQEKIFHGSSRPTKKAKWKLDSLQANQNQSEYEHRVRTCQDFIAAGDIYQANLSHRFDLQLHSNTSESAMQASRPLFQRLRQVNPSPFSALVEFENFSLVSSSPERLVSLRNNVATIRPIAGTRPRGHSLMEDRRLIEELVTSPKERSEHIMLVDLARNDLGRVCQYGSVHVDELMGVERYSHVAHLVSNVMGTLHPSKGGADLIQAAFPGGTITGVPKIRCMEIIEQLEPVRRGPYTGAIGYWSWNGNLDFNIIIRTLFLTRDKGYLQVGAGIVADSDPVREYEETLHKAQALFQALHVP